MNEAVRHLLDAFDALPEADKHQATVEIFRRVSPDPAWDISEWALVEAAENLFQELDATEVGHPQP